VLSHSAAIDDLEMGRRKKKAGDEGLVKTSSNATADADAESTPMAPADPAPPPTRRPPS